MLDEVNKCGLNPHVNAKVDKINNTAARFREVRTLLKLTQQQMANGLHMKRNTIAKIESGHTQPSARTVSLLEEMLIKSISPKVDAVSDQEDGNLAEDPAPYGAAETLKAEIRAKVEQAIDATDGDRVKLGWLLLQISEHARPQAHWSGQTVTQRPPAEVKALRDLEKLRTRAAEEMGRQMGASSRRKTS